LAEKLEELKEQNQIKMKEFKGRVNAIEQQMKVIV
jgi:hypothetical protein